MTIELAADGVVVLELVWNPIPLEGGHPGWTCAGRRDEAARRAGEDAEPVEREWPWDADRHRELALLEDAIRDHRRERTARGEMRVHYWERQARDASAEAAAAWGRELLGQALAAGFSPRQS